MDHETILEKFREEVRADLAKGGARPLPSYLDKLGGELSAALAREYEKILAASASHATGWGPTPATDARNTSDPAHRGSLSPPPRADRPHSLDSALDSLKPMTSPLVPKGELARGGMGAILRVRDETLSRDLAMKVVIDRGEAPPREWLERFVEEAHIQAQLDHPGVVPIHQLGLDEKGGVCFTMKLVKGRSLEEILRARAKGEEEMRVTWAVQVLLRVCETLSYAHEKGVIHRDLKPANIMVGKFGEVYVMDWGIAKVLSGPSHDTPGPATALLTRDDVQAGKTVTRAGAILGTAPYMAPEQAMGLNSQVDEKSDVYALGATLYEILAGKPPYDDGGAKNLGQQVKAVIEGPPTPLAKLVKGADELVSVAEKAMARDRGLRYPSAREMAQDLQRWIEGRVVHAHQRGTWPAVKKWVGRNRALSATLAAALVVVAGLSATYAMRERDDKIAIAHERDNAIVARDLARRESVRADGLRLATIATSLAEKDPTLAALLAVEGADRAPGPVSTTALYAAAAGLSEARTLTGHEGYVRGGGWSADGKRVFTVSDDGKLVVWSAATGEALQRVQAHDSVLSYEQHGGRILTRGKDDPVARVWDADTLARTAEVATGAKWIHQAALSPDGSLVATADGEGPARVWDAATGREVARFAGHGEATSVAWSPDGRFVASGGTDLMVRVWDARNGVERLALKCRVADVAPKTVESLRDHRDVSPFAAWSPDGSRLVTWGNAAANCLDRGVRAVRVWDTADGRLVGAGPVATPWEDFLGFTFDGREAMITATVAEGRRTTLVDVGGGATRDSPWRELLPRPEHVKFGPDGRLVAFTESNYRVTVCSTARPTRLLTLSGHTYVVGEMAFSPDGARLLTCSNDRTARIWDVEPSHVLRGPTFVPGEKTVSSLQAGGRWVAAVVRPAADAPGTFQFLDARTGRAQFTSPAGNGWLLSATPDGRRVVRAGDDVVEAFDTLTGASVARWDAPGADGTFVAPDGRFVAVRSSRMNPAKPGTHLYVFDLDAQGPPVVCENTEPGPEGGLQDVSWSADGSTLAAAHGYTGPMVWNAKTGALLRHLEGHTGMVLSVVFSSDGRRLASQGMDASIRVWNLASGEQISRCLGLLMARAHIAFSADGKLVAAASTAPDAVRIFDVDTGAEWARIPNYGATYCDVRSTPKGEFQTLQTDGVVRIWPIDPASWIRARVPRRLSLSEADNYGVGDEKERLDREMKLVLDRPTPAELAALTKRLMETGRVADAERCVEFARKTYPEDPRTFVGEARLAARRGEIDAAFDLLRRADARGLERRRLPDDPGFLALHADPRWAALLSQR